MASPEINPRDIPTFHLTSSSQISKTTSSVLNILYPAPPTSASTPSTPLQEIVALQANSPVASKAITIAEITKRRIAERGGKWYQYTRLGEVTIKVKPKSGRAKELPSKAQDKGNEDETESGIKREGEEEKVKEEEEDPFEILQKKEKLKKRIPVLTIFISLSRIDDFADLYG